MCWGCHRAHESRCVPELFYAVDHIVALLFAIAAKLSETCSDLDVNIDSGVYLRRHSGVQHISDTEAIVLPAFCLDVLLIPFQPQVLCFCRGLTHRSSC